MKSHVLQISTKPLLTKQLKTKLAWPGYRELLSLDRHNTEKIESDDQNENYLEKLLKKEQEEKRLQEQQAREDRIRFENEQKEQEKRQRIRRKLERKRMIEDGLIDPHDPDQQEQQQDESEESVLQPVQAANDQISPESNLMQSEKSKQTQKQLQYRTPSKSISAIHEKRCRSQHQLKRLVPCQPYTITNAIYLTERKALPSDYSNFLAKLKYRPVNQFQKEQGIRPSTTNRLNPERLRELSKPKSAGGISSRKEYAWTELNRQELSSASKDGDKANLDFNFVIRQRPNELRRHTTIKKQAASTSQNKPPKKVDKLSLSQMFLRKMFIKSTDEKMFVGDLGRRR